MQYVGLNWGYLIASTCGFFVLPVLWIVLSLMALNALRQRSLEETPKAIWSLTIVLVPILGAIAFWMVRPGAQNLVH